jgi:hypothetical protein
VLLAYCGWDSLRGMKILCMYESSYVGVVGGVSFQRKCNFRIGRCCVMAECYRLFVTV